MDSLPNELLIHIFSFIDDGFDLLDNVSLGLTKLTLHWCGECAYKGELSSGLPRLEYLAFDVDRWGDCVPKTLVVDLLRGARGSLKVFKKFNDWCDPLSNLEMDELRQCDCLRAIQCHESCLPALQGHPCIHALELSCSILKEGLPAGIARLRTALLKFCVELTSLRKLQFHIYLDQNLDVVEAECNEIADLFRKLRIDVYMYVYFHEVASDII
ncbi:hypothetical protein FOCC_FOCC002497 [Frankliniella occidentalis]|nr:hypothetical protein FOCC_FOCC002497 [Frankliniella occidentalis]